MKKTKVAVIGTGYLGRFHAEKYSKLESTDLVAVVDADKSRAEEVAKANNTKAVDSYEQLYDIIDAASVVTPTETHAKIGIDLLKRGIHVLIEKPMAANTEEAEALIRAAEEGGAVLQVGHLERFNPAVVALKGKVENPVFIESHRLSPFPHRSTDVDVVLDLMIHDIDIILNLVGAEIESVDAVGIPVISKKIDIANARLQFKNGCVANVTASRVSRETLRRIRIFQPETYVSIDYAKQHISISKLERGKMELPSLKEEELELERKDSLYEEIKSFTECASGNMRPLVGGKDGKRALIVAAEIQRSVAESLEKIHSHFTSATATENAEGRT